MSQPHKRDDAGISPVNRWLPKVGIAVADKYLRELLTIHLQDLGCETLALRSFRELDDTVKLVTGIPDQVSPFNVVVIDEDFLDEPSVLFMKSAKRFIERTFVILLTAFDADEHRDQVLAMGAAAVFDKPFDISQFIRVLRRLLFEP